MAHFAEIDENNIVIRVLVVPDEEEHRGQDYLSIDCNLGGRWLKTSYNTRDGIYYDPLTCLPAEDQSKAFRKNYASTNHYYDEELDAFIPIKPFDSWTLNEDRGWWEPPIPMPETGGPWEWNEELGEWEEIVPED